MNKEIGKELRLYRNFINLTLRDVEEKTGVSYIRLGKFERGEENPTKEIIHQIEKGLDMKFSEIFEISKNIDVLFQEFLESIFYYDENIDLFKAKIINRKKIFGIKHKLGKLMLIEYIVLVLEEKIEEARNLEDEILEYFRDDQESKSIIYQYKGVTYCIERKYDVAIFWLNKALSTTLYEKNKAMINYHMIEPYMNMGKILDTSKCIDNALIIFNRNLAFKRVVYCYLEYAFLLKREREFTEAISYCNKVLKVTEIINFSPILISSIYRNICWMMIIAEDYNSALEYLEEVIMIEPKHPFTVLYGIWCNYKLERFKEAEIIISENEDMKSNKQYSSNFELFALLVKYKKNKPTNQLLDQAIKIVDSFTDTEDLERIIFYIDIVLELLERRRNDNDKVKFLEMKINLLQNGCLFRN